MDIYPFKICGSGYDIISEKSGYDPFLKIYVSGFKDDTVLTVSALNMCVVSPTAAPVQDIILDYV